MRRALVQVTAAASLLILAAAAATAGAAGPPNGGLATAVYPSDESASTFRDVKLAGASAVRILVHWPAVATSQPASDAEASDPSFSGYDWQGVDTAVQRAVAAGLQPYLDVLGTPTWAAQLPAAADPALSPPQIPAFSDFATALATRYDGAFDGLPRVRVFQVWNEPNLGLYLMPQLVRHRPVSPAAYRDMVNAFAAAVKAVHADNLVIAGGLAPFRDTTADTVAQAKDWGPLSFMRDLLCISPNLRPTCNAQVRFDIWSMHPYTSGDPNHHAVLPNDVSLGDLPKVTAVLDAAVKAHHVVAAGGRPAFWITEFSWDSNPPDPKGVPVSLLDRWVPQALYQAWRNGVSLVTWFTLTDQPLSTSFYQSGLFTQAGRPKPYVEGFRFPFVAFRDGTHVDVWGRTPAAQPGRVVVQVKAGGGWRSVTALASDRNGIFQATLTGALSGWLRARYGGEASLPFSLRLVPDHFYNPFGLTQLLEPKKKP